MNTAETISVNPVNKTLGALHPEATLRFINTQTSEATQTKTSKHKALKLFFASTAPGVNSFGAYILVFRLMFSSLLIGSGVLILSQAYLHSATLGITNLYLGLGEIIAGGMLALDLLSRIAMLAMTVLFAYLSIIPALSGVFDMQSLLCFMGSLLFLVLGSGKYSCDFLISKAITLNALYRRRRQREERLSYRAFRIENL